MVCRDEFITWGPVLLSSRQEGTILQLPKPKPHHFHCAFLPFLEQPNAAFETLNRSCTEVHVQLAYRRRGAMGPGAEVRVRSRCSTINEEESPTMLFEVCWRSKVYPASLETVARVTIPRVGVKGQGTPDGGELVEGREDWQKQRLQERTRRGLITPCREEIEGRGGRDEGGCKKDRGRRGPVDLWAWLASVLGELAPNTIPP